MQQFLSIFGGNQMDYAELYLWDIPVVWSKPESGDRELISLRDRTPRIAAEGCDIEALIQAANPVRIVTIPFHHLFGPLEVDDVVRCIRVPELIRGTSYVNPRRPDSIA